uniref:Uncharacterized protein n=1 Tax=Arundo donax TaxID=35708 RepID=A0A0A9HBR3_ARUDO
MLKPSQTMLDKLLFNWCYPNSIIIANPHLASFRAICCLHKIYV